MKKQLLVTGMMICLLMGCASSKTASHSGTGDTNPLDKVIAEKEAEEADTGIASEVPETAEDTSVAENSGLTNREIAQMADISDLPESDVDVDLTLMNATMVYSRVLNLLTHPETYVGMTVRMDGAFAVYVDEEKEQNYYACIIADAAACCAQGIEFVRGGDYSFPEDYPAEGEEVVVEGVFEIYEEDGFRYVHLTDAEMTAAKAQ